MRFSKEPMTRYGMVSSTASSKRIVDDMLKRADAMRDDTKHDERVAKSLCKACFYVSGWMGGAAITTRPCMCCGETQTYGSTFTDKLCLDCATEHSLCKHCGGDREMRERRRNWPEATSQGEDR